MGNRAKGEVTIEDFGGKDRRMCIGWNQLAEFEELMNGISFQALTASGRTGFKAIRALFYVGLRRYDKSITLNQVGEWLGESGNFEKHAAFIAKTIEASMPDDVRRKAEAANQNDDSEEEVAPDPLARAAAAIP
jgi:hypothetical protein